MNYQTHGKRNRIQIGKKKVLEEEFEKALLSGDIYMQESIESVIEKIMNEIGEQSNNL